MKNFDIIKWAKKEQIALSKMDDNSKYVARYIECTLLPKLKEVFHTSSNSKSMPRLCTCGGVESDPPAVCAECGGLLW